MHDHKGYLDGLWCIISGLVVLQSLGLGHHLCKQGTDGRHVGGVHDRGSDVPASWIWTPFHLFVGSVVSLYNEFAQDGK